MRPYLLKGHERPLTQLRYNREGDLLVSCAKDHKPNLWYSDDGTRVGTFDGHNGAVWTCDFDWESTRLITASADSSVRLWDVQTGECLFPFKFTEPCRAVRFAFGDRMAALTTDPFLAAGSAIHIVNIAEDITEQTDKVVQTITGPKGRIQRVIWTDLNNTLISAGEDGTVRRWDVETGKMTAENLVHEKHIQDLQMSPDGSHLITASLDKNSKLLDVQTLEVLKVYKTDRPCNSAAISPSYPHVLLGGGQDASQVTTTSARAGKFESKFFHKIFEDEFATVRGHFGPLNAVAFHPENTGFATGGEDGYVRLHHFDNEYYSIANSR